MNRIVTFILIFTSVYSGSKDENGGDTANSAAYIRIFNDTSLNHENLKVENMDDQNLHSRNYSEHKKFELAYRYTYVELNVDRQKFLH